MTENLIEELIVDQLYKDVLGFIPKKEIKELIKIEKEQNIWDPKKAYENCWWGYGAPTYEELLNK